MQDVLDQSKNVKFALGLSTFLAKKLPKKPIDAVTKGHRLRDMTGLIINYLLHYLYNILHIWRKINYILFM